MRQGGFLFTTAAGCSAWPATQQGHWTAAAFFYASMLFALVAIFLGSQQLLVLPSLKYVERPLNRSQKESLRHVWERLARSRGEDGKPSGLQVVALQAPLMVLSLAVLAFFAGLCSVIFAPLAQQLVWNDDAKVGIDQNRLHTVHTNDLK